MSNAVTTAVEMPPAPQEPPVVRISEIRTVPLREQGASLPIGILREGVLHRGFAFSRWNTRTERELEEVRREHKGPLTNSEWVTVVLGRLLTKVGPYEFQSLTESERRLVLTQMFMVDVMYLLLWLRVTALGPEVKFNLKCPACGTEFRAPADLEALDVKVAENPGALAQLFYLRDGVVAGGREFKTLTLDPPRWQAMLSVAPKRGQVVGTELAIVLGSIRCAVDGDGVAAVDSEALDDLSKYDLEHLKAAIDGDHYGPDMSLISTCPNEACGHETKHGVDWSWDFFFKSASL